MLTTICYPEYHQHQRLCNPCCLKCQLKEIVSAAREIFRFKVGGVLDYKSASHAECWTAALQTGSRHRLSCHEHVLRSQTQMQQPSILAPPMHVMKMSKYLLQQTNVSKLWCIWCFIILSINVVLWKYSEILVTETWIYLIWTYRDPPPPSWIN